MKVNDVIHGFEVIRVRESAELSGTLYKMKHIRTGAELAFLDNKEDNKLFSVAFKTLPWDDTGVFHILEHSVLAGSDNYPVKEPFLDLLKTSMNTFLNAMTFPDKTMYPVSSRNEQDFLNLTRVYLDAVFRPSIYHKESIFRQEGWHYEIGDNEPFYNGVVFNEMKGALSSVDGQIEYKMMKNLFPDSIYGFESGGDPKAIPSLTYEKFLDAHREFYSPSNAKIYLDGDVPLDKVLEIINGEYLGVLDFVDKKHEIKMQEPIEQKEITDYYEIGKEDDENNKTQIVFGRVFSTWKDRKRALAYKLISNYLAETNESPLKRAILEKGLAQNVEFPVETDSVAQPFYMVVFRNTEAEKKEEIKKVYTDVLNKIISDGIDKDELTGCLNQLEFSMREPEEPSGLMRNIYALNSWLHDGDMMLYLENNEVLSELRDAIDTDYYTDIIKELVSFDHTLTLTMLPSKTKGDDDAAEERERVNREYNSFSDEEKAHIKKIYDDMRAWQDAPDSEEAKATLPVLDIKDVSATPRWTDTEVVEHNGVKVLYHKLKTNGIVHANLYFDISDISCDKLSSISMLTKLLAVLPTDKHTSQELQKEIKKTIGKLSFSVDPVTVKDSPLESKLYFTARMSVLEQNLEKALELLLEILTETDYRRSDYP